MKGGRRKEDRPAPRLKLWLSSGGEEGIFGDGKWRLLDAVGRSGSLRGAAESLGISYRKAWGDLRKAERCLGLSLVVKQRGGPGGGLTRLTKAGRKWACAYSAFRLEVEAAAAEAYQKHIRGLLRST